jgi:hypothetical protein
MRADGRQRAAAIPPKVPDRPAPTSPSALLRLPPPELAKWLKEYDDVPGGADDDEEE